MSAASQSTIAERLGHDLTEAIVSGAMPAGTKISEPALSRRYRVSRGPLREAIRRLEGLGLVRHVPHAGARVVTLSRREVTEIYLVREALEGMAARLAARDMSPREIASLGELLDQHARAIERDGPGAYIQDEGELDFHYRVIQASGNRKLITMLCGELYHLIRMLRYRSSRSTSHPHEALAEHRRIHAALADGDEELAELLMRRHVAASRRDVERRLESAAGAPARD